MSRATNCLWGERWTVVCSENSPALLHWATFPKPMSSCCKLQLWEILFTNLNCLFFSLLLIKNLPHSLHAPPLKQLNRSTQLYPRKGILSGEECIGYFSHPWTYYLTRSSFVEEGLTVEENKWSSLVGKTRWQESEAAGHACCVGWVQEVRAGLSNF